MTNTGANHRRAPIIWCRTPLSELFEYKNFEPILSLEIQRCMFCYFTELAVDVWLWDLAPPAVRWAYEYHLQQANPLYAFLTSKMVYAPNRVVTMERITQAYQEWCQNTGRRRSYRKKIDVQLMRDTLNLMNGEHPVVVNNYDIKPGMNAADISRIGDAAYLVCHIHFGDEVQGEAMYSELGRGQRDPLEDEKQPPEGRGPLDDPYEDSQFDDQLSELITRQACQGNNEEQEQEQEQAKIVEEHEQAYMQELRQLY
jgi:hypothetical protein